MKGRVLLSVRRVAPRVRMTLGLIGFLGVMMPAVTFSWNQATHAYIADRLGARVGHENLNEMWGSVAPDLFNFVFAPALCPGWISDQTQGADPATVMNIWNAASTDKEKALAFGFVSHNQTWGADFVAHVSGLRPGYENDGYIITKAKELLNAPSNSADPLRTFGDVFASLGMSSDEALLVAHVITEDAVDIRLGNEVAPQLGRRLATAARSDTRSFPPLLARTFAADYADHCFRGDYSTAATVLTATEQEHRKNMILLGQAISQTKPVAVRLLSEQLVGVLPGFLGRPLPIADKQAVQIVEAAMFSAMGLCDDYKAEIEATIEFVGKNLKDHGITYGPKKADGMN
jgi:hypothetical protein